MQVSNIILWNPTFSKYLIVGNLRMMNITISTYFSSSLLWIYMIDFVPITSIVLEISMVDYLKKKFDDVKPIHNTLKIV